MNYYRRFVGDYLRDTQHLTMEQDGGYGRLLDKSYTTEKPLPKDKLLIYRMVRAFSESERGAIDQILAEFFILTNKGYIHKRVKEEIKLLKARAKTAKQNGKHGGRPANPQGTHRKPTGLSTGIPQKSSPDSRLQTPEKEREEKRNTYARAWPSDLVLLPAMREYAIAKGVPDPEGEFTAWHDDCLAHGRQYQNWMAAWRTRVGNYAKFSGGKNGAIQQPKSFDAIRREEGDAATRRLLDRHLGRAGDAGEALPALPGRAGKADLH